MGPYSSNPASINSLYKRALYLRRNTQCSAFNSVFMGYPVGLMNEMRNAGNHQVNLDGFSNGLYIMSITSQNAQQLIKIQKN